MVLFLGEITNSQVAINNGTVTQTMVEGPSESYRANAARTPRRPDGDSPSGKNALPSEPVGKSLPADTAGQVSASSVPNRSVEEQLLRALDDLLARLDQLGLDIGAQQAVRRAVAELQSELSRTPVDTARVHAAITEIRAQLAGKLQAPGSSPADSRVGNSSCSSESRRDRSGLV
ncbi:hypothetical protein [Streptomyces sp. Tue6028]|uniref:hypothetical protein n=1 Tax=Streptomyces sp. Tue6028 TaxID=2036037 RepID=UPI00117E1A53|nr:hypothetical protein [Streptomyces sp. Tue6028]